MRGSALLLTLVAVLGLVGCSRAPAVHDDLTGHRIDPVPATATPAAESLPLTPEDLGGALEGLLAEHAAVVFDAMRAAYDDVGEPAAQLALEENTAALGGAVGLVYGTTGGRAFQHLWAQHAVSFVAYADALADGDSARQRDAVRHLTHYERDFASFTSTATGELAPEAAVTALLTTHVDHLLRRIEAYAAGDDATVVRLGDEAAAHMVTIAGALAEAIVTQFPERFADPAAPAAG